MSIVFSQPPLDLLESVKAELNMHLENEQFTLSAMRGLVAQSVTLDSAHKVFNLGLDEIIANKGLTDLKPNAWRFLVHSGSTPVAAAESTLTGATRTSQLASVNSGAFVSGTVDAFSAANNETSLQASDYEPRLLRIPALYVFALWLHTKGGVGDTIRVITPAPNYLQVGRAYTPKEFLSLLREPARQRLAIDDTPRN
jgi:hypothetical protein